MLSFSELQKVNDSVNRNRSYESCHDEQGVFYYIVNINASQRGVGFTSLQLVIEKTQFNPDQSSEAQP
jgi:hypothetical protein